MDKLEASLASVISKLDAAISAHAAEGLTIVLNALWWDTVFAVGALVFFLGILAVSVRAFTYAMSNENKLSVGEHCFFTVASVVAGLISSLLTVALVCSVNWVALIDPRMGLALKILHKAGL